MSVKQKIRIALIGLGGIAQKAYLPIVANHSRINPILCSRNKQTLKALSLQYRIDENHANLDDLIREKPDAAMVHSATESHVEIVSKLLKAKIPVFVDKPLSYSLDDSEKLIELAAKNNVPLYVGFNRRFAPLISSLQEFQKPLQISWQKNRVDHPGDPRVFIFDDFIHVIDGLLFLAKGKVENLNVVSQKENDSLINIQVHWQQEGTLLRGGMNRMSGITEEKVEYFSKGNKWLIDNLHDGFHFTKEKKHILSYDNWISTLYKRGFVDMIEDWINVLDSGESDNQRTEAIWRTHNMCEKVLNEVGSS